MAYEGPDRIGLDYYPCRYGTARGTFRGPAVPLDGPYTAVIGGSEVYGKFVEDPFCDQFAERTGLRVANLGVMNGGLDAFVLDEALMRILAGAECVVVQALGAQNMSNRFYTVHPRRNDRFLRPSKALQILYPDMDFSDVSFTRHLLCALRDRSAKRFVRVEEELKLAWISRMQLLLSRLPGKRVLLRIEDGRDRGLGMEPLFVDSDMMQEIAGSIHRVVCCDVTDLSGPDGRETMVFPAREARAAEAALSPAAHSRIADAMAACMRDAAGLAA